MYLLPYLEIKNQAVEDQVLTTATSGLQHAGDGQSQALPTVPINRSKEDSTAAPQPARIPPSEPSRSGLSTQNTFCWPKTQGLSLCLSGCGGVLTDTEGSFSSPNHPASYPPNSLCVWVIQVPPPYLVQIHVSSLTVEGPSPCLFDWVEVREQIEQTSVVTRSAIMKHTFLWTSFTPPYFHKQHFYTQSE